LGQWRDLTTSELQFLHNLNKSKSFPPKTNAL
jgi:23S rRNA pseudouridine2457 synthase